MPGPNKPARPEQLSADLASDAELSAAITALNLGTAATYDVGTNAGEIAVLGAGGTIPIEKVASGTPNGKKFVRDDGTLAEPSILGRLFSGEGAPPAGAPSVRAAGSGAGSVAVPAGVVAGDLIVAVAGHGSNSAGSTPSGFTPIASATGGPGGGQAWRQAYYKIANGTESGATLSFGLGGLSPVCSVAVIKDADTEPIVTAAGSVNGGVPSVVAPTANSLLIALVHDAANGGTGGISVTGMTEQTTIASSGRATEIATKTADAGATGVIGTSGTGTNSYRWAVAVAAGSLAATYQNGDFYLDKTNRLLYGPLTAGAWGTPTPLDEVTQAELDALDTRVVTLESAPAAEVTQAELDAVEAKILGRLLSGEGVPAAGAPTLRAATQVAGDASPTELTVPATVEEGDLVLVLGSSASTAPAGFTQVHQHTSGQEDIRAWWRIAPSGFAGTVLSWNSPYMGAGFLAAFSAIDVNDPFDSASAVGDTAPSVVAEVATLLVEAWMGSHVGGGAVSVSDPSGTISAADGDRAAGTIATRSVSAGATVGRSATISGALLSASFAFALRPHPSAMGTDGDFYLDKTNRNLYGPLTAGAWGTALPIDEVTQAELDARIEATVTALPTAAEGNRGKVYILLGGTGVADIPYICLKDAADAYAWHQMTVV